MNYLYNIGSEKRFAMKFTKKNQKKKSSKSYKATKQLSESATNHYFYFPILLIT